MWILFSLFSIRSLGVHCSKVRSLTLDSWEPELLKVIFKDCLFYLLCFEGFILLFLALFADIFLLPLVFS